MKEIYETPELNLISYVPAENLAATFEDLLNGNGGLDKDPISDTPGIDY